MPDPPKKLTQPRMKGLLQRQIMFNVGTAITLGVITGVLFRLFICDVRKKKFEDYYREFDPEDDITKMLKMGADFQSCPDFR
ncbi:unnamed protein product [Nezara viridula]|uniref:Mitochondrial cytochrome c oxidase subunit VIc/VIIs domain-containing protein n=1 Tax=Nezara viridula TaxID=85310 RepID=A0A9P0E3J5_NEZVI|nr:unnamed protein product [Nezara viridula]